MRVRHEDFGAILAIEAPPALVHVDHDFLAEVGLPPSPLRDAPLGHLSAPTEVHVLLTERCPAGCPGCYVDATPRGPEPSTAELRAVFEELARAGVFHVALGGGESLLRDDLFELAAYARSLGLVPNLTTSGISLDRDKAERCRVFGQVNVSLDGIGEAYRQSRGYDGEGIALEALRLLSAAGVACGINTVVNRHNVDDLDAIVARAAEAGAHEVELLRFKPAGRGATMYAHMALDEAARRRFVAGLGRLVRDFPAVRIKIDCSFVPFLCATDPDPERLDQFGVIGCEAGNVMAAVRADLRATPCSFVEQDVGDTHALVRDWNTHPDLLRWRGYATRGTPEPCASCTYRALCRGGCKVVTRHLTGYTFAPDPECPRVIAHARGEAFVAWESGLAPPGAPASPQNTQRG